MEKLNELDNFNSVLKPFSFPSKNRRTKAKTEKLMQILERQEWIDPRTRAVFTEFTLYNANVNLYASVIMGVEWMATGSAITRTEVKVTGKEMINKKYLSRIENGMILLF